MKPMASFFQNVYFLAKTLVLRKCEFFMSHFFILDTQFSGNRSIFILCITACLCKSSCKSFQMNFKLLSYQKFGNTRMILNMERYNSSRSKSIILKGIIGRNGKKDPKKGYCKNWEEIICSR